MTPCWMEKAKIDLPFFYAQVALCWNNNLIIWMIVVGIEGVLGLGRRRLGPLYHGLLRS